MLTQSDCVYVLFVKLVFVVDSLFEKKSNVCFDAIMYVTFHNNYEHFYKFSSLFCLFNVYYHFLNLGYFFYQLCLFLFVGMVKTGFKVMVLLGIAIAIVL